jgi:hypothetical protein
MPSASSRLPVAIARTSGNQALKMPSKPPAPSSTTAMKFFKIRTGSLTDSIESGQIDRIYAMWARATYPFGLNPARNF